MGEYVLVKFVFMHEINSNNVVGQLINNIGMVFEGFSFDL